MPTEKHLRPARRRTAELTTAPRADELSGTLTSGLDSESQAVLGETREEFALLQAQYYERFRPTTPEERFQLDTMIRHEWSLRRFFRVEAQLWEYHTVRAERGTGVELGEAFTKANAIFMRLQRRISASEKAHKEAMAELKRLKQSSQPQDSKAETQQLASLCTSPLAPACPAPNQLPAGPGLNPVHPPGPDASWPAVIKSGKPAND